MTAHDAHAVRATNGWTRWGVLCSCGLNRLVEGGKEAAERYAQEHNVKHADPADVLAVLLAVKPLLAEECYDPDSMEYGPNHPCPRCRVTSLLRGVA